ncbi:MAG TPA: amidohydrolase family protein [Chitinophagaceae bacterium]|nr:amidohydrolase family protein [Chitinophagaceae bacterium]
MKKIINLLVVLFTITSVNAQETIYPAKEAKGITYIKNGTVHVGNGQVFANAVIKINNGKIEAVGTDITIPAGSNVIDAAGKQVYPGLILPSSQLGIVEIGGNAVRGSNDFQELGDINTNIRSIAAYNADSKIINTLRANGILLAQTVPVGSLIAGTSSTVQLDAWNFEDAAYVLDNGLHFYMPSLLPRPSRFAIFFGLQQGDVVKEGLDKIEVVRNFFRDAKAYLQNTGGVEPNLKLEAVKGLFNKKQKLFIHANEVKQMLIAIDFVKEFGFDVVIVGAAESWQIADLLKQNNIAVILSQEHSLPTLDDDDIDQPFKAPAALQKAGVLYCLNDDDGQNRGRNLPFNAGTAVTYGLTKEEALSAITMNTAKILGIADRTGSIEAGKDANIIISNGDILDMRTSVVTAAFIQGRQIELSSKHTQLFERYKQKYNIK